jgi:hypothetical protein
LATQNANLLHDIGISQMDVELKRMIAKFKDKILEEERDMEEQTGISANMETVDMEEYVKSVIKEVVKRKEEKDTSMRD